MRGFLGLLWVVSGLSDMSLPDPLYPRKRTSIAGSEMSAKCQQETLIEAADLMQEIVTFPRAKSGGSDKAASDALLPWAAHPSI